MSDFERMRERERQMNEYVARVNGGRKPKFGDRMRNLWASEGNPTRDGIFVRAIRCQGQPCYEMTNGKGKFWTPKADGVIFLDAQQDAPTDAEIQSLWSQTATGGVGSLPMNLIQFARALLARYAPAQDAERERDTGIEAAARWIDTRRDDFDREHGHEDPDTGAWEYGTGPHAEAKREYSFELAEIAEGLRALKSDAARAQRAEAPCDHKRVVRDMAIKGVRCLDCGTSVGDLDLPVSGDVRAAAQEKPE